MSGTPETAPKPTKVEVIKEASNYLRGTILEGLADDSTGAIAPDDTQLTKFHGIYQQDDRDLRKERRQQKLERAFYFMIRVRVPGGICSPAQWLEIDRIADTFGNGSIKITTRQAFQLHGVIKGNLKATIRQINDALLNTLAACGDVNRNVMCNPNPYQSELHQEVYEVAIKVADHLSPRTKAYHEIWLDGEKVAGGEQDHEPIYGKTYLPRKFKTAFAIPPSNDVDVFTHDLGFIAIIDDDRLAGFNVTVGGGLGMDHGKVLTFPRLADVLGFITIEQIIPVAEAVVTTQRDFGDRSNRKHARMKYTIEDRGIEWFKQEVEQRAGLNLQPARHFKFDSMADRYGWTMGINGMWHFNLFIQNGRVKDTDEFKLKRGVSEIARVHQGDFRLTPNQNLIIANISEEKKPEIEALLSKYGLLNSHLQTGLRLNSLACVALPTCGLALAESERQVHGVLVDLEKILDKAGLRDDEITIRMTGCPNACARPYDAEIGLVGRAPGKYNLYLGAAFDGSRLNKLYKKLDNVEQIAEELDPILRRYAVERNNGERFGDFCIRAGYVKATEKGSQFHD